LALKKNVNENAVKSIIGSHMFFSQYFPKTSITGLAGFLALVCASIGTF
jgi:hypothetical protein